MSWRKYFKTAASGALSPISGASVGAQSNFKFQNYGSLLPEVYMGHPNRIERYNQYEAMDMDSEVNSALDIISEFCTQTNHENGTAFDLHFFEKPTETEISILKKQLQAWYKLNQFEKRMFKMFRNVLKYGDQVFLRDPETFKLFWVDMTNVTKVIVNESQGKEPEQYVLRNVNPNFENLTVTQVTADNYYHTMPNTGGYGAAAYNMPNNPYTTNSRFNQGMKELTFEAQHILHMSLSEGLDANWPFGNSILENVFKVFKQKELLEDSIIIYRVQRAPERRVFKIDVGNMPSHLAMAFVERVKNEIHQRRIPTQSGGTNFMDSTYNPMSMNEDYFFPHTCLSLDTSIKLLDGRDLKLSQIIQEYQNGKENFVYTVNQKTLEVEPGKIVWANVTRKNAKVLEVLLDNGEKIVCTPDHRFIMRDGSEIEAQHLVKDQSVMPLYLIDATTGKHQGAGKYLKYICPSTGKSKWVHTMVCPKLVSGPNTEIHHIDLNSRNNNPTNLIEMETKAHRQLHRELGSYHLINAWNDAEKRNKIVNGIRNYHKNASSEDKKMMRDRGRKNGSPTWANPITAKKVIDSLKVTQKRVAESKKIVFNDCMAFRMVELYNEGYNSITKITKVLRTDSKFQQEFHLANKNIVRDSNKSKNLCPTDKTMNSLCQVLGYKTWGEFKDHYSFNHKVVSITWLDETIDTGDITIESSNNNHNFALSSGVFVHNSDGRGSSVETLAGGQNLGEIDDLKFFTNKLFRGLRIPSSYLPTGAEDSAAIHNDGKVATALIQEHRFNQYCMRLQGLVCAPLDKEFKAFLKWRGFNIDNSMFELRMNEPQNFAQYRQAEVDGARISAFTQLEALPYLSKRFSLKRFLGLTEEEMLENNQLWREENTKPAEAAQADTSLRNVGISAGGLETDLGGMEAPMPMGPEAGGEGLAAPAPTPEAGTAGAAGAAGAPPAV